MSINGRIVIALAISLIILGVGATLVRHGLYGLTLFVAFPVIIGSLGSWAVCPRSAGDAAAAGAVSALLASGLLFFLGLEGAICIVMTWPLAAPLGALGGWCIYSTSFLRGRNIAAFFLLPSMTFAFDTHATPPVFEVTSVIDIAAPPEEVWKNVVSFSELPAPEEWFFRAGIAYPQRAHIDGAGPGAIRYCEFSTGPFVEPIEVWDEPRLLRFSVTQNPPPMREWSPYSNVLPKHLQGYLISKRGQFRLISLPNGGTRLEGTTWYQHGLWPAQYWKWWSDAIIHRIHLRVLHHIRSLSEHS